MGTSYLQWVYGYSLFTMGALIFMGTPYLLWALPNLYGHFHGMPFYGQWLENDMICLAGAAGLEDRRCGGPGVLPQVRPQRD